MVWGLGIKIENRISQTKKHTDSLKYLGINLKTEGADIAEIKLINNKNWNAMKLGKKENREYITSWMKPVYCGVQTNKWKGKQKQDKWIP